MFLSYSFYLILYINKGCAHMPLCHRNHTPSHWVAKQAATWLHSVEENCENGSKTDDYLLKSKEVRLGSYQRPSGSLTVTVSFIADWQCCVKNMQTAQRVFTTQTVWIKEYIVKSDLFGCLWGIFCRFSALVWRWVDLILKLVHINILTCGVKWSLTLLGTWFWRR